jgi:outer membrane protein assembly factor BamB
VKGFGFPDNAGNDVFFSTDTTVWCGTEADSSLEEKWSVTTVPNPSTPVFVSSRGEVWVGGGDGRLYRLNASTGAVLDSFVLAGPSTQIGSPSIHDGDGFVYVGAVDGRVFAVPLP